VSFVVAEYATDVFTLIAFTEACLTTALVESFTEPVIAPSNCWANADTAKQLNNKKPTAKVIERFFRFSLIVPFCFENAQHCSQRHISFLFIFSESSMNHPP
jgi:hypothetical protein